MPKPKRRRRIMFLFTEFKNRRGEKYRQIGRSLTCEYFRLIELDQRLKPRDMLITAIHESLHLANWELPETKVERMANAIGDVLWRMGYRKEPS